MCQTLLQASSSRKIIGSNGEKEKNPFEVY
jgi:hypothetical protein